MINTEPDVVKFFHLNTLMPSDFKSSEPKIRVFRHQI